MTLALKFFLFVIVWCMVPKVYCQYDPLKDFCRRFGHQSAVVDNRLYIDGGFVNWKPFAASSQNYSNPFLLYSDLSSSEHGMPQLYSNLSKNATIPSVNGGALWEDSVNKRLYLYGGEYYQTPPPSFSLFSYDILYDNWANLGPPRGSGTVTPSSYGAGVSISWRGEAYYYGGWFNKDSVPGWTGPPQASNRLIKYTMDSNTFSNLTGPDNVKRADGSMVFIPAGDAGMLVYFGGSMDYYGNGTITPQSMSQIFIYDIANTKWYSQTATGRVPENRRRFCSGATWSQDQSSYNIYLYGGAGFLPSATGYDDIYILTIPSFKWIRGPYPPGSNSSGPYPKSMMTCNVVNNAQMLVIGGTYSNDTTYMCDADVVYGQHNMNLGEENPNNAIWAEYQPTLTTYAVPTDILTVVGGQNHGGAKVTAPVSGFDSPDMSVLMTRKAAIATRSPTRVATNTATNTSSASSSSGLSGGAIAGIVIGSLAAIIGIFVAGCCFIRRRQKHYKGPRQNGQSSHLNRVQSIPQSAWGTGYGAPSSGITSPINTNPMTLFRQPQHSPVMLPSAQDRSPIELGSDGVHYQSNASLSLAHADFLGGGHKYTSSSPQVHPVHEMHTPSPHPSNVEPAAEYFVAGSATQDSYTIPQPLSPHRSPLRTPNSVDPRGPQPGSPYFAPAPQTEFP
ncbi:hypothetical protein B0H63DRAFT_548764 [Podospora didyma]|uniref:Attractin/MKLN-like beta-propeller domain-containing protein n=1 Tax=Podospora didyma TaxID=330526 RepID=A0AAE0KEM5_9PEZI|nr:hypothetical protein B0H63DRAFT_548764 [Podospora didyma]